MLKEVVQAIDSGKASRKEDLVAVAGMNASAVDAVLDFLVKREYLKVDDDTLPICGSGCGHCGSRSCCTAEPRRYIVTEKGKRMARNAARRAP